MALNSRRATYNKTHTHTYATHTHTQHTHMQHTHIRNIHTYAHHRSGRRTCVWACVAIGAFAAETKLKSSACFAPTQVRFFTHAHIHMRTCTNTHAYAHACTHLHKHTCMCTRKIVCMYIQHTPTHHTHMCTHVNTRAQARTHTRTRTHMYTHKNVRMCTQHAPTHLHTITHTHIDTSHTTCKRAYTLLLQMTIYLHICMQVYKCLRVISKMPALFPGRYVCFLLLGKPRLSRSAIFIVLIYLGLARTVCTHRI